jgi:hypothetical protein
VDNCGICVGGNTGVVACAQDCNGDWGGTAVVDNCGTCTGGNTGAVACSEPNAVDDEYTLSEDTIINIDAPGVLGNDLDADGDTLSALLDDQPMYGEVVLNPNGSFTYTPNENFNGDDSFVYHANDGFFNSTSALVMLNITPINDPPTANAGADLGNVELGTVVELNGSDSNDIDGDTLAYNWIFIERPDGSVAELDSSFAVQPSFTVDDYGTYIAQLVVNDGTEDSTADTVVITTINNEPPVAVIGPVQDTIVNSLVCLDGSASYDPNGDDITFLWSLATPTGSTAVLDSTSSADPCFTPDVQGEYHLTLTVDDGLLTSEAEEVTVQVASENIEIYRMT